MTTTYVRTTPVGRLTLDLFRVRVLDRGDDLGDRFYVLAADRDEARLVADAVLTAERLPTESIEAIERQARRRDKLVLPPNGPTYTIDPRPRATLSVVCSDLLRIARGEEGGFEEMHAYGAPGECGVLIHEGAVSDTAECLLRNGWEPQELLDAVAARTSPRWVHFGGAFLHLVGDVLAREEERAAKQRVWAAVRSKKHREARATLRATAGLEDRIADEVCEAFGHFLPDLEESYRASGRRLTIVEAASFIADNDMVDGIIQDAECERVWRDLPLSARTRIAREAVRRRGIVAPRTRRSKGAVT